MVIKDFKKQNNRNGNQLHIISNGNVNLDDFQLLFVIITF